MQTTLPPPLLSRLSELVATKMGLHFPPERRADLGRGIAAAAADFNFPDAESCAHWLLSTPLTRQMNGVLAGHLSVGETYFFRERQSLEAFGEHILPQLLQSRRQHGRRLRIWSAGCSTGEEAYTVAILLDRLVPDLKAWDIAILATDFNPDFLRKAAQGVYGEWSFRNAPGWLREHYFKQRSDGRFEIHPRIREMVAFSYLNFADEVYPSLPDNTGAMDVIFCRNVLMYFTAQRAQQLIGNFHRALIDGGWLIVSPAEASYIQFPAFAPVEFPGAVLYRNMADAGSQSPVSGHPPIPPLFREAEAETAPPVLPVIPVTAADERGTPSRMARDCADRGKLGEALAWCEKAIASDKMNPSHHYLSAAILQEQGRYDIAIQPLMRALYLDPDFVFAHISLGNLHRSRGRYRQAQRHFGNALALLRERPPDEILPEADGLMTGRLIEMLTSLLESLRKQALEIA